MPVPPAYQRDLHHGRLLHETQGSGELRKCEILGVYILLLGCRQCFWVVYCVIWLYTLFLGCILCYRFSTPFMGRILHFCFFPVLYSIFLGCIKCPWLVHTVLKVYILSVITPGLDPWLYTQTLE